MVYEAKGGVSHKLINATQLIADAPLWLSMVAIAGEGDNADCQIYDGLDTTGEKVTHLEALSGTTVSLPIHPDSQMYLRKGLYVVVNASTTFVTLAWYKAHKEQPDVRPPYM